MTINLCSNILIILLISSFVIYSIYIYKRSVKFSEEQLKIVALVLKSPQKINRKFSMLPFVFQGYYQGRKIFYTPVSFGNDFEKLMPFYVEPNNVFNPINFSLTSYPKPTKNTKLKNKKIYFVQNWITHKFYTEIDLKNIFEELSLAAEKVELGLPYFAK